MKRKIDPAEASDSSTERIQRNVLLHANDIEIVSSLNEEAKIAKKGRRKEYSATYHRSNKEVVRVVEDFIGRSLEERIPTARSKRSISGSVNRSQKVLGRLSVPQSSAKLSRVLFELIQSTAEEWRKNICSDTIY